MTKTQETGSRAYLLSIVLVAIIGGLLLVTFIPAVSMALPQTMGLV
mgnify:FL=1